jgi:hypothetical protein
MADAEPASTVPLHVAAASGDLEAVRALLAAGVAVDTLDEVRLPSCPAPAAAERLDVGPGRAARQQEQRQQQGLEPSSTRPSLAPGLAPQKHRYALHYACENGGYEVAHLLISRGATLRGHVKVREGAGGARQPRAAAAVPQQQLRPPVAAP